MNTDHEYKANKDITVVWHPEKCEHAGICVKMLPGVYHPKDRPWITPEKASCEELVNQITQCPTGALAYKMSTKPH